MSFAKESALAVGKMILIIGMSIGFTGIMYLVVSWLEVVSSARPTGSWVRTVATLANGNSRNSLIEYELQGVYQRQNIGETGSSSIVGKKWTVLADTEDYSDYILEMWNPVFTAEEVTETTSCELLSIDRFRWGKTDEYTPDYRIAYAYAVDGIRYRGYQVLPPQSSSQHERLTQIRHFPLRYLVSNPNRAVVLLPK